MNRVIKHTGSKYPIIQAPMGWIARSQLASAVCEAGGMGIIETSSGEIDNCKKEILKMIYFKMVGIIKRNLLHNHIIHLI